MNLQQNNRDFRELLPFIDTGIYKNSFIPSIVWRKLGNKFDLKSWKRVLTKLRVRFVVFHYSEPEVNALYFDDKQNILLRVSKPHLWDVDKLKFEVIQTIMHEYVHVHQYYCHPEQYDKIIVKTEVGSENEYLSCFGEIQAFAHCLAIDILEGFGPTWDRYEECHPKVKRIMMAQSQRWLEKHLRNLESINNTSNITFMDSDEHQPNNIN